MLILPTKIIKFFKKNTYRPLKLYKMSVCSSSPEGLKTAKNDHTETKYEQAIKKTLNNKKQ